MTGIASVVLRTTLARCATAASSNYFDKWIREGNKVSEPIIGSPGDDQLVGTAGDDVIDISAGGNDTVAAAEGNDTIIAGGAFNANDHIDGGSGSDVLVIATGGFGFTTLGADTLLNVEKIVITQAWSYSLTTNDATVAAGETLIVDASQGVFLGYGLTFDGSAETDGKFVVFGASQFANELHGGSGDDLLIGGAAGDYLNGGAGADTMVGGQGGDIYFVDSASDVVVEDPSGGFDAVVSSVSYILADNVEKLTLTGTAILGAGNASDNQIVGNSADNVLEGGAGNDTIDISAGGTDIVVAGEGDDVIIAAGAFAATDRIDGGTGTDTLVLDGNYSTGVVFDAATLVNVEKITIRMTSSYSLTTHDATVAAGQILSVDASPFVFPSSPSPHLTFDGSAESDGQFFITGSSWDDVITGGAGNDTLRGMSGRDFLNGGAGADVMTGGTENDTYVVDNPGDVVVEVGGNGIDLVLSSVSYVLPEQVENLNLMGTEELTGTGNSGANLLVGNAVRNTLYGQQGNDTLEGGAGDDVLDGGSETDTARFAGSSAGYAFSASADVIRVVDINATDGDQGTDTLLGIERARFSNGDVRLSTDIAVSKPGSNRAPTIAGLADGGYVVVWPSVGSDGFRLSAQRYAGDGSPVGSETRLNTSGSTFVQHASASALGGGGYVIAWQVGQDFDADVYVQRFDSSGTPLAAATRSNTYTTLQQENPTVGGLADGGFVVTWQSMNQDGSGLGIYLQRYNANGVAVGSETRVNSTVSDNQTSPTIAALNDGGYVVAWRHQTDFAVYMQRYDAGGAAIGIESKVSTNALGGGAPAIAKLADGGFVVTWQSTSFGSSPAVYARRYDVAGTPVGGEFRVTADSVSNPVMELTPAVVGLGDGGYVITWESRPSFATGLTGSAVLAQRYARDGSALGAQYEVNTITEGDQSYRYQSAPVLASLSDGGYTVAWDSQELGSTGISARRFGSDGAAKIDYMEIRGTTGNDILNAREGNQTLDGSAGADAMSGGAGNDTYIVDNIGDVVTENPSEGNDTVQSSITWTLSSNVENLVLTGSNAINGTGNASDNALTGNAAANVLDGGAGSDTLIGGAGDDTYVVDSATDAVIENPGEGTDTVNASVTWVLGANLENLTLSGQSPIDGTGNELNNVLTGNSAANVLDGGAGSDTLIGGAGNDTYVVDATSDVVVENPGAGIDTVRSSVTWTLGADVENLVLTGSSAINGTGNALDNTLLGNSAANVLVGGDGNDVLDGGAGVDSMDGGLGDDKYYITAGDVLTDAGGIDTIVTDSSWTLATGFENLTAIGTAAVQLEGNNQDNVLVGNDADNYFNPRAGNDTMIGNGGNDTFDMSTGGTSSPGVRFIDGGSGTDTVDYDGYARSALTADLGAGTVVGGGDAGVGSATLVSIERFVGGAYNDRITGSNAANELFGRGGNDTLDGGAGADTLRGGVGNDTYYVDNAGDVIVENAGEGTDSVFSSISWTLGSNVENLTLTGSAAINATGNGLNNVLTGNSGANVLNGGAGSDSLAGGLGNDTYVVDVGTDVVTENAGGGTDTVLSSVSWTLGANLENLTLTGTALNGTGNALNNVIVGNSAANSLTGGDGDDTLDGGDGIDTLDGGNGNDSYYVTAGDKLKDSGGIDTVYSGTNWTLATGFENLTATGTAALDVIGTNADNVLVGNDADNYFNPKAGNDTMIGNGGNDTFDMSTGGTGNMGTRFIDGGAGIDFVDYDTYAKSGVVADLAAGTVLGGGNGGSGSATISGVERFSGASYDDRITGSSAAEELMGRGGNDTLDGAGGNDTLIGGSGNDVYRLGRGYASDLIQENDSTAGNRDVVQFLNDIAKDQVWFQHSGNDLLASVIGTSDLFTIQNWYLGSQYRVEEFKASDGSTLLANQVQNLVNAMASFSPPAAGQTTLPPDYATALAPTIAANWT